MSVPNILFKGFFWKGIQFLVSIILFILLAHVFKAAVSGEFQTFVYLFSLLASFFGFGLDIGLNYFLTKRKVSPENARKIIIGAVVIALAICLPCIYFFYQQQLTIEFNRKEITWLAAFGIAGGILSTLSNALFTAYSKNHVFTKFSLLFNIILLILILIIVNYFHKDLVIHYVFKVWFLIIFLQGIAVFIYSTQLKTSNGLRFSLTNLKEVFIFSFSAFLSNFIFLLASRLPIFLLQYWLSQDLIGNYIYAYKIIDYASAVVAFIYFPTIAIVASSGGQHVERIILFLIRLSNTFVLLLSLLVLSCGAFLFSYVFGKSFSAMHMIFIFLMPAFISVCSSIFFTAYFFGSGFPRFNFISACILMFVLLLLIYPFTKLWGVNGTAMAFSVANVVSLIFDAYMFRRVYRYALKEVLIVNKKDVRILIGFGKKLLPSINIFGVSIFRKEK